MYILFWNYRGAVSRNFTLAIFDLLRIYDPWVIILVEPKVLMQLLRACCIDQN